MRSKVDDLVEQRQATHGDFRDVSDISQDVMEVIQEAMPNEGYSVDRHDSPLWKKASLRPFHREAIKMIVHKLARVVAGDPDLAEHWLDVEGYARRVRGYLEEPRDDPDDGPTKNEVSGTAASKYRPPDDALFKMLAVYDEYRMLPEGLADKDWSVVSTSAGKDLIVLCRRSWGENWVFDASDRVVVVKVHDPEDVMVQAADEGWRVVSWSGKDNSRVELQRVKRTS